MSRIHERTSTRPRPVRGRRPFVFRGRHRDHVDSAGVLDDADVLVIGDRDRRGRPAPGGTRRYAVEIDASGGIIMPGMIDTHRHMWQTAPARVRRRLGAEPVLRLLLPHLGRHLPARGHLRRQPAQRARVGRHRSHHDARLVARPAHPRLRRGGPPGVRRDPGPVRARPTATTSAPRGTGPQSPEFRAFVTSATPPSDMVALQHRLRRDRRPRPSRRRRAFEAARDLGLRVTTHAGVWGANGRHRDRAACTTPGFMTAEI